MGRENESCGNVIHLARAQLLIAEACRHALWQGQTQAHDYCLERQQNVPGEWKVVRVPRQQRTHPLEEVMTLFVVQHVQERDSDMIQRVKIHDRVIVRWPRFPASLRSFQRSFAVVQADKSGSAKLVGEVLIWVQGAKKTQGYHIFVHAGVGSVSETYVIGGEIVYGGQNLPQKAGLGAEVCVGSSE